MQSTKTLCTRDKISFFEFTPNTETHNIHHEKILKTNFKPLSAPLRSGAQGQLSSYPPKLRLSLDKIN